MPNPLESLAARQAQWSATAGMLKDRFERVRWVTFGLSILGALCAAIASQIEVPVRTGFAAASAVVLAVGALLSARFLGTAKAAAWVRARAASEAFKRAAYAYASQAAPYDDPATRDATLRTEVQRIENDVDDLLEDQAPAAPAQVLPSPMSTDAYCQQRVRASVDWYTRRADEHQAQVRRLRAVEFSLALATAVLTAVVGAVSKEWLSAHTGFDWVSLAAVLTTISGAILAHIEAARYDYIVVSYRAAARKLRAELDAAPAAPAQPSPEWSAFVGRCEGIIEQENGSWVARFSKP